MVLFKRTRPLVLTAAGEIYYEMCREVLRIEDRFRMRLEQLKDEAESNVRVASIYSVGLSEISRLQSDFAARYPNAALHVDYMRPDKIYEALVSEHADLGLISYPAPTRELAVIPWRAERMAVAVSPSHPLALKAVIEPADLNGQEFVGFDEDLMIRRELDRFFREQGISVNIAMQFDNIQMIKEAVALGSGISILPARTMQAEIDNGRLVSRPLDAPQLVRPVGIVHLKRKAFNRAALLFVQMLREQPVPEPAAEPALT